MGREDNVKIFEDTRRQCEENAKLKSAIIQATSKQQIIYETDNITVSAGHRYDTVRHRMIPISKHLIEC